MGTLIFTLACVAGVSGFWIVCVVVTVWRLAAGAREEWRALEFRLAERDGLIKELCAETQTFFRHDSTILRVVAELAAAPSPAESEIRAMRRAIAAGEKVRLIYKQVGVYPTLFHSRRLIELHEELLRLERTIGRAIALYNGHASAFNARRHDFASSVITRAWSHNDLPTLGA